MGRKGLRKVSRNSASSIGNGMMRLGPQQRAQHEQEGVRLALPVWTDQGSLGCGMISLSSLELWRKGDLDSLSK